MKLLFITLLSVLCYHYRSGFPVVEGVLSENIENATSLESWFETSNETASDDSSSRNMHGVGKKVVNKVKEGIKTVKDKVKDGFDKVKNKVKDFKDKIGSKGGFNKDKVKDFKDQIGSKGGYYKDKYDRDNDRDKYNRDYDRDRYNRDNYRRDNDIGSGFSDPNAKWIALGIGVFMLVGILVVIICFVCKIERD